MYLLILEARTHMFTVILSMVKLFLSHWDFERYQSQTDFLKSCYSRGNDRWKSRTGFKDAREG